MRRAVALALALAAVAPAGAQARERWDTQVLALVPTPGYPAHAYAAPNGRVYEGTYTNPNGDSVPSRVFEYEGDGTLLRSWTVRGQRLDQSHGVQVATSDGAGRLVLLDKSPPRALLLDPRTGEQTEYASFPEGSIPNYAAWGPDFSLYVTDYAQAVLWRIPPGGGPPEQWLADPRFDGGDFGTTGIELGPDQRTLYVAVQSQAGGAGGNPSSGRMFTIPIQPDGRPGEITQFWESRPADGPDGFGFAKSGNIYIALLATNQLAMIDPQGVEKERFPSAPGSGANGSPVPFDAPSNASFLGTRVVVGNQSYFSGDRSRQAILDVETGEEGMPELVPPAPRVDTPPPASKPKRKWSCRRYASRKKRRACRRTMAKRRAAARRRG